MQTLRASARWQVLPYKITSCLIALGWLLSLPAAAAEEPAPLTTAEMEALMLPPVGWKMDGQVLRQHLWTVAEPDDDGTRPVVYAFWPAFVELKLTDDGHVSGRVPGYAGALGGLLSSALASPDAGVRGKAERWLRHSLILYFTGFRLSRTYQEPQQRPYAPWIRPADSQRLDRLADRYLAQQRVLIHSGMHPEEISERELAGWLSHPGGTTLSDVYGYFDAVGVTHYGLRLNYLYPIHWTWSRNSGNQTLTPCQGFGHDLMCEHTWMLIGSEVPESPHPVSLWLRDVYLSYIAGKELFESKRLPTTENGDAARVQEAVQMWWKHIEKQR